MRGGHAPGHNFSAMNRNSVPGWAGCFRRWLAVVAVCVVIACSHQSVDFPLHPNLPENLRSFLLRHANTWEMARDGALIAAGEGPDATTNTLEEARLVLSFYREWFPEAPPSITLFILHASEPEWRQLVAKEGLRPDGIAFHAPGLLVVKEDVDQNLRPDRLPHELIHAILSEQFPESIPLWLDEGWAGFYGWELVRAASDGSANWTRRRPAIEEIPPYGLDELSAITAYPEHPEAARMFYRESEEVIRALEEELGRTAMGRFLDMAVRQPMPLSRLLIERWGWHEQKVRALEWRVQQRCRMPRILR